MPDIFIPVDTAYNSKLYTNLVRKGALNRYTTDYGLKHRDALKAQYGDFEHFNKDFTIGKDLIDGLKAAAKEAKVEWNDEQFAHSEKFILLQMKALIARNVWDTQQYYQVMASVDPGIQKAMEVLGNEKVYKRILKGK
jgi:carboxyl-terminal processing protease